MSSSEQPKLWTELTKIRHIFRKQSTLKVKAFKNVIIKSSSPVKYSLQKKKLRKILLIFDAEKWLWKYDFEIFDKVVHNFGKSKDDMI